MGYEFKTFLVGVTLKPSMIERDDMVRSRYALRGAGGLKGYVARCLAARLSRRTGTIQDHDTPDLTITVDFRDGSIRLHSRSLALAGRYAKSLRGLPQRQGPCRECAGNGCKLCELHGISGFESVEGRLSGFFYGIFDSNRVKLAWIGGEEKESTVEGNGRPFFARVVDPKRRSPKIPERADLGGVEILNLQRLESFPSEMPEFRSRVRLCIETDLYLLEKDLECLLKLKDSTVRIRRGTRKIQRRIHDVECRLDDTQRFTMILEIDGGIPVRELVEGGSASPSFSEVLGAPCRCAVIDYEQITV